MKIETFHHTPARGWSVAELPALDGAQTLVLAFGESHLLDNAGPLEELLTHFPSSILLGCSTAGAVLGTQVVDETLSVAVVRFDQTHLRAKAIHVHEMTDSFKAGKDLGTELIDDDLKAVFVLSDGLRVNGSELISGLNDALPPGVVVTGGLAGDGSRFQRTWVLNDGKPAQGMVTAVGFYGEHVQVGHGSRGGWDLFGPERTVTRSSANILYEIDGKPALALYKTYLGDLADGLPGTGLLFPLALREDADDGEPVVRTLLAVDEQAQSMTFAGNIPEGSLVRLMKANMDRLIVGAEDAALRTRASSASEDDQATLCVAISCVGRRLVLGERTEEELESALEILGSGTQQVGFYSYGELSPYASGRCDLHNQTMTLTTINER